MQHLMNTYGRLPVSIARGEGPWVWDTEGRRYLDALTGIAVTGLGHAHPRVVAAIAEQAARVIHASNLYRIPEQERLADTLARVSGMDRAFFCNSGCEANEAAIKLARLHGHHRGIEQPVIVVMEKAFHGRTMATLSATGSRKVQAGFEPLLAGRWKAWHRATATWWRCWPNPSRARAASIFPTRAGCGSCASCATGRAGC
jgi:acetylornithine aminotransferase